jgi:hypothetical protein
VSSPHTRCWRRVAAAARGAFELAVRCYKRVLRDVHEQLNHNLWQSACSRVSEKDRLLRWLEGG